MHIIRTDAMNLMPTFPQQKDRVRYVAQLVDSSWFVLDRLSGQRMGRARYTVEIQARWTAEAMEEAYRSGLAEGKRGTLTD